MGAQQKLVKFVLGIFNIFRLIRGNRKTCVHEWEQTDLVVMLECKLCGERKSAF